VTHPLPNKIPGCATVHNSQLIVLESCLNPQDSASLLVCNEKKFWAKNKITQKDFHPNFGYFTLTFNAETVHN